MADPIPTTPSAQPVPALPTGWRANPVVVRAMSLHWWLAVVVAPILYFQAQKHANDAAGPVLKYVLALVGGTAFISSDLFTTPVNRAKIAHVDAAGVEAIRERVLNVSPSAKPLLALLLIPVFIASGCASWRVCELGKLKASEQSVIADVTAALASADYLAALAQIAATETQGVVDCTVQAIMNHEQAKVVAAAASTKARVLPSLILQNAQQYLSTHKPVACAEVRRAS